MPICPCQSRLPGRGGCALLGPSYHQEDGQDCASWCDPRQGSRARFLQALGDLAARSGHPELAEAAAVDPATGRLLPLSEEERKTRTEALGRALEEIESITDETDTDETWREVFRGIDAGRPHRPLFEGMY